VAGGPHLPALRAHGPVPGAIAVLTRLVGGWTLGVVGE
jgi:hypothetical protein